MGIISIVFRNPNPPTPPTPPPAVTLDPDNKL